MKQVEEQNWMESTLNSLDGLQRQKAPADLFEKAMIRSIYTRAKVLRMPVQQLWSAAACGAVLIVANLFLCLNFSSPGKQMANPKESFAKEYFGAGDAPQF